MAVDNPSDTENAMTLSRPSPGFADPAPGDRMKAVTDTLSIRIQTVAKHRFQATRLKTDLATLKAKIEKVEVLIERDTRILVRMPTKGKQAAEQKLDLAPWYNSLTGD